MIVDLKVPGPGDRCDECSLSAALATVAVGGVVVRLCAGCCSDLDAALGLTMVRMRGQEARRRGR